MKEGFLKGTELAAEVDISLAQIPQIIQIIQYCTGMTDAEAMSSFNMWVPFVISCPPSEESKIIEKAWEHQMKAENIGRLIKKEEWVPSITIKWVGIGKSELTIV